MSRPGPYQESEEIEMFHPLCGRIFSAIPGAELRDALVAIGVAMAAVASAVAMVIIPQILPAPAQAQAPVACRATHAQHAREPGFVLAQR
jgi:hypothetical protein